MKVHNTEIDPTTITRLTIEHGTGLLDLSGDHARAAIAQLRRTAEPTRPARGYRRPAAEPVGLHPTAAAMLETVRKGGPLTVEAASIASGLCPAAAARTLASLGDRVTRSGSGRRGDPFVYAVVPAS